MLAVAAFAILPFMLIYAFVLNKKMRLAFKQNRVKIADINAQIEDNLSGIRVVKSFANEEIENRKFKAMTVSLQPRKTAIFTWEVIRQGLERLRHSFRSV